MSLIFIFRGCQKGRMCTSRKNEQENHIKVWLSLMVMSTYEFHPQNQKLETIPYMYFHSKIKKTT